MMDGRQFAYFHRQLADWSPLRCQHDAFRPDCTLLINPDVRGARLVCVVCQGRTYWLFSSGRRRA